MASIQFCSTDSDYMAVLSQELTADLQKAELAQDLQVGEPETENGPVTRGDMATLTTVALAAVSAGGALTVLLSKEGFLASLASVLEKYVEGRRAHVVITTEDGRNIDVQGPASEIREILAEVREH